MIYAIYTTDPVTLIAASFVVGFTVGSLYAVWLYARSDDPKK